MGIPVDPATCFPSHPSDRILEEYAFSRLPEVFAAPVEEHLLICHICQDALTERDQFVSALKVAARQSPLAIGRIGWGWPKFLAPARTSLTAVVALAMLALLAVQKNAQEPAAPPVAVSLSSPRGPDTLSPAPAGKRLLLSIDAPDLVPGKAYRVEMVDGAGRTVLNGAVMETAGRRIATTKPLRNGVYWVRLYGDDSELLREFGLAVR